MEDTLSLLGVWVVLVYLLPGAFLYFCIRRIWPDFRFGKSPSRNSGQADRTTATNETDDSPILAKWGVVAAALVLGILLNQALIVSTNLMPKAEVRTQIITYGLTERSVAIPPDDVALSTFAIESIRQSNARLTLLLVQAKAEAEFLGEIFLVSIVLALIGSILAVKSRGKRRQDLRSASFVLLVVAICSYYGWIQKEQWFQDRLAIGFYTNAANVLGTTDNK